MELFVLSLIVWRVSYLLTEEAGPWGVIARFKDFSLKSAGSPLYCLSCTSVWVGLITALLAGNNVLLGFAYSALAIFMNIIYEKIATL